MGYIIGVSSGVFKIAQPQEKLGYIDLSQKGFYSAFKGVNFTQIDLESSAEFISPDVNERLRKLRDEMNVTYGVHGLMKAMGANGIFLDSAVKEDWQRTHFCLHRDLGRCVNIESKYLLQHASETAPYDTLGKQFQPSDVVDIWGRPLYIFLNENDTVFKWLIRQEEARILLGRSGQTALDLIENPRAKESLRKEIEPQVISSMASEGKTREDFEKPEVKAEAERRINERVDKEFVPWVERQVKDEIIDGIKRASLSYGSERVAYLSIAKWMSDNGDPIWKGIVGDKSIDSVKRDTEKWVPAVSLKYIYGHFFPDDAKNASEYGYSNIRPFLSKIMFVIETETGSAGDEESPRVANPNHFIVLCREMEKKGLSNFKAAIDFEHALGAGIKVMRDNEKDKEPGFIDNMPSDGGKYVGVLHVGWPTPLGPAHVPIFLGSEQQEWLYKWIYTLKKKGFSESENRYIIFERAGGIGGDPVDQSTLSLKKIVEFLRLGVKPEDLTQPNNLHFYGIDDSSLNMQFAEVREHMMDPIKGLLQIPEEQHGFIGGSAVQKGKAKEWEAGKMR